MKNKKDPFSINAKENWGGLVDPESHDAAVGMRLCDNRQRRLQGFADRKTVIGDHDTAVALQKWLGSKRVMDAIRRNTSFARSVDDRNMWATREIIGRNKDLAVTLNVMCSGEYCYVRAYADLIPVVRLGVESAVDGQGDSCWRAVMWGCQGGTIAGPLIFADGAAEAMSKLVGFVANELEAKGCLE